MEVADSSYVVGEVLLVESSAGRKDANPLTAPIVSSRCSGLVHGKYLFPIEYFASSGTQRGFTESAIRTRNPCTAVFGPASRLLTVDELRFIFETGPASFEYELSPTYTTHKGELVRVSLRVPGCRDVMYLDSAPASASQTQPASSRCGEAPTELRFHEEDSARVLCRNPAPTPNLSLSEVERCLRAFANQRYPEVNYEVNHLPESLGKLAFRVYTACERSGLDQPWSELVAAASREIGEPAIREQLEAIEHSPVDYDLRLALEAAQKNRDASAVASIEEKINAWSRNRHRVWFLVQIANQLAACVKREQVSNVILEALSEL